MGKCIVNSGKSNLPANNRVGALVIASILRPEGTTGVHKHIREVQCYFKAQGVRTDLVTPFCWAPPLASIVFGARLLLAKVAPPLSVLWYRYWHTVFLTKALRRRLTRLGPVVVYAQGPEAARAALSARRGRHQVVVMAVHFLGSQARGWVRKGLIKRQETEVAGRVDGIVFVSESARAEFVKEVPTAGRVPCEVVPNFLGPLRLTHTDIKSADLVTIGSLEKEKNLQYILRLLAVAREAGHIYSLDVFGKGPLRRQLKRTVERLGLSDQVRLRGFYHDVSTLLPAYCAYIHASPVEAGPYAIVEALRAGLPVIAPIEGGAGDIFTDGVEGVRLPLNDETAATAVIVKVLGDATLRCRLGERGRARFRALFESSEVAPQLERFFLCVCEVAVGRMEG